MSSTQPTLTAINKLKTNPNNPRAIRKDQLDKLVKSLREFPEMLEARPIVVDPDFVVLGGNMRLKAAQLAGLTEVPVYVASWEETKHKEFIIKDNLAFGEWDWDMLANEWDAEELDDWGLEVPLEDEPTEGLTDPDDVPEVPEEPTTKPGDLWILGDHRLLCGDSTKAEDVERLMDGNKADLLHTDPPYGVDYEGVPNDHLKDENLFKFLKGALLLAFDSLKPASNVYVWHADVNALEFFMAFRECGFVQAKPCTIQWLKPSLVMSQGDYHLKNEPCLFGWKKGPNRVRVKDRTQTTIWECERTTENKTHPTMKPVELCERAIINSSLPNQLVLDLFLGSGSTLIAAEKTNRKCYGMELDPKYCDVIVKRWEDFTGKKAELWKQ